MCGLIGDPPFASSRWSAKNGWRVRVPPGHPVHTPYSPVFRRELGPWDLSQRSLAPQKPHICSLARLLVESLGDRIGVVFEEVGVRVKGHRGGLAAETDKTPVAD
jgi:hypothetical protein